MKKNSYKFCRYHGDDDYHEKKGLIKLWFKIMILNRLRRN